MAIIGCRALIGMSCPRQQACGCSKRQMAIIGFRVLTGMSFPRAATNAVEARSRDVLPSRSSPVETLKAWKNAVLSRGSQRFRNGRLRTCSCLSFFEGWKVCVIEWRFAVCVVRDVGFESHLLLDVKEIVLKCPLRTIK
jgi:hypothetical protein